MTSRHSLAAVVILLLAVVVAGSAGCAGTPPVGLVAATNTERLAAGLEPLTVDASLTALAEDWASTMSGAQHLSHRPELGATAWERGVRFAVIGENVGTGSDIDEIAAAFVASPAHMANIIDPRWTRIGVAVAVDSNGVLWVAVNFADAPTS